MWKWNEKDALIKYMKNENNKFIYLIKKKKVSSVLLKGVLVQKKELLEVNNE